MSLPLPTAINPTQDARALKILAKTFYRELRGSGYEQRDVLAFAGELLTLVSHEVRERREPGAPVDKG